MRPRAWTGLISVIGVAAVVALPGLAAGQSASDLRDRINKQRRGLELAPTAVQPKPAASAGQKAATEVRVSRPADESAAAGKPAAVALEPPPLVSTTAPEQRPAGETDLSAGIPALKPMTDVPVQPASVTRPEAPADGGTAPSYRPMPADAQINIRINFDFDSAVLRTDQKPKLVTLCEVLKTESGTFQIIGHTDGAGPADYNLRLSRLRAAEVKRYLVEDCGLQAERLQAVGYGEQHLLEPAHPLADENRRVELQLIG